MKKADLIESNPMDAPGTRRVIKIARTEDEINATAHGGFRPLIQPVKPNPDVHDRVVVFQDPETGEIQTTGDVRWCPKGVMVMS